MIETEDLPVRKVTFAQPDRGDELSPDLTDDAFLGGALRILQPKAGYRAGVDALLLAAAVSQRGERSLRVLDIGAGVGTVGLSVARRIGATEVTLVEAESRLSVLAARNIARNGLSDRVRAMTADITGTAAELQALGLASDCFDHVVANPPFHFEGRGTPAPVPIKAAAHAMPEEALDLWVRVMARYVAPGGLATMIHKADALGLIMAAFQGRFGAISILPIHPRRGEAAIRVLVTGTKGSRAPLSLREGFVLHDAGHDFTPKAAGILRHGDGLDL
ncbi:MAG: methyltransferase [Hyphomicrobium sp.]|nr:MAG: methyltransferase [Hyphomicrobium sp.]